MSPRLTVDLEPRMDGRYACEVWCDGQVIAGSVATPEAGIPWAAQTLVEWRAIEAQRVTVAPRVFVL